MKCSIFDIALELAVLIEQEDTEFRCELCKGTIHFLWECKECGTQLCTYCLTRHHLHGKDMKELDEEVYKKLYKERDEAKAKDRQEEILAKLKKAEEKRIEKANQRIAKEEIKYLEWKDKRKQIIAKYGVGK